jgi:Tfp pilus assembly protein PilF
VELYERSIAIAPYLHEAHAGLAQTHLALGRTRTAERYWRTALEHTYRESTRSRYEAQLAALSGR